MSNVFDSQINWWMIQIRGQHLTYFLKREYVTLVDKYGFVVQETFTVQDPPASPPETILLPPLKCLHKTNERIQERPHPGDSRPVMTPSHRTLSRQIMRKWEPWKTNMGKSNNHRMLQQLAFHKRQTIKTTRVQDLDPRSYTDNPKSLYWHMR